MDANRYSALDRRPLYPERIVFDAPRGTRTRLRAVADASGLSLSELIRRALVSATGEVRSGQLHPSTEPGLPA